MIDTIDQMASHSSVLVWIAGDGTFEDVATIRELNSGGNTSPNLPPAESEVLHLAILSVLASDDLLLRSSHGQIAPTLNIVRNIPGPNGSYVLSACRNDRILLDQAALVASASESQGVIAIASSEIYRAALEYQLCRPEMGLEGIDPLSLKAFLLLKQLEMLRRQGLLTAAREALPRLHNRTAGIVTHSLIALLAEYDELRTRKAHNEQDLVRGELRIVNSFLAQLYANCGFRYTPDEQEHQIVRMLLQLGDAYQRVRDCRNALRQFSHALMFVPQDATLRQRVVQTLNAHVGMVYEKHRQEFDDFATIWRTRNSSPVEMWDKLRAITLLDELENIPESTRADGTVANRLDQVKETLLFFDYLRLATELHPQVTADDLYHYLMERHDPRLPDERLNRDTIETFRRSYFELTRDEGGDLSDYNDQTRKILWLSAMLLPYARVLHGDESTDAWKILPGLLFHFFPEDIHFPVVNQVMALTTLHRNFGTLMFGEGSPMYTETAFPNVNRRLARERDVFDASALVEAHRYDRDLRVSQDSVLVRRFVDALDSPMVYECLDRWRDGSADLFSLFPNFRELSQMLKYRVPILQHVFEQLRYAQLVDLGTREAYQSLCERKRGRLLMWSDFQRYHDALHAVFGPGGTDDYRELRRLFYLVFLFHDLGESRTIEHADFHGNTLAHEQRSAILFPEVIARLEHALDEPRAVLSPDHVKLGKWLIGHHPDLNSIHFGERTLPRLFSEQLPISRESALRLLACINSIDLLAIYGGEALSRDKVDFFMRVLDRPDSLVIDYGRGRLFEQRIAGFSGNHRGVASPAATDSCARHLTTLARLHPDRYDLLRKNLGNPEQLEVLNYAVFFLQSLSAEDLVKLLLIISELLEANRRGGGEEIHWVEFTAKSAEAPFAAEPLGEILKNYSFDRIAGFSALDVPQICSDLSRNGLPIEVAPSLSRLTIDNKRLSDLSRYIRLAALGATGWVIARGEAVLTDLHLRNYAFLNNLAKVSVHRGLGCEWPKLRLLEGILGAGIVPMDLEASATRYVGLSLAEAARRAGFPYVAEELELLPERGEEAGFQEFLRHVTIKNGIWFLRCLAVRDPVAVVRLLYACYCVTSRYEESSGTSEGKGRIRVLKFSHQPSLSAPSEAALCQSILRGLRRNNCAEISERLRGAPNPYRELSVMLGLVGMGTQVERTEGEPPDTLLVTLTGEPVRRQRSEFTLDIFFDEDAVKAGLSGGKGSSLARLQAIPGIVVPEGFIVTTHAYDAFIAQSGELLRRIEEIEVLSLHWITKSWAVRQQFDAARGGADAGACVPELESLEARIRKMSEDIRGLMAAIPVPAEVERCVLAEYARMEATFRRLNIPVAVRSSSVAEDTSEASFAGQHDTFLNQVGRRQVLESLRNCWISVFGERAVFYRNHASLRLLAGSGPPDGKDVHFRHRLAKMAVVVQRMVEGAAAGVGFSLDPSSGRDDVTLNANFGLGESVVQGGIGSPDKMVFSSRNLDLHVAVCGRKERQVVSLGLRGGVEWRNVPETDRHRLVLTPERGAEIARAVLKVKEKYGRDVDTEFVLEPSGTLYFVQARPVTTSDPTVQTVESGQVGEPFFLVAFVRGQGSHAA